MIPYFLRAVYPENTESETKISDIMHKFKKIHKKSNKAIYKVKKI